MEFEDVEELLEGVKEDRTVPKNVRESIVEVLENLSDEDRDINVRLNNAISILDEVSSDQNIPMYARTQIWNVVSLLESKERD